MVVFRSTLGDGWTDGWMDVLRTLASPFVLHLLACVPGANGQPDAVLPQADWAGQLASSAAWMKRPTPSDELEGSASEQLTGGAQCWRST